MNMGVRKRRDLPVEDINVCQYLLETGAMSHVKPKTSAHPCTIAMEHPQNYPPQLTVVLLKPN